MRSAVSETEHFARVSTVRLPDAQVQGAVVGDLIHLLAELVDNATAFSPPDAAVTVRGNLVGKGVVVEVEDQGLGIEFTERERLNQTLAHPPDFQAMALSGQRHLGLFVVGQLAQRHGITVSLLESAYGGIKAIVLIPSGVVEADGAGGGDSVPRGPTRTARAAAACPGRDGAGAGAAATPHGRRGLRGARRRSLPAEQVRLLRPGGSRGSPRPRPSHRRRSPARHLVRCRARPGRAGAAAAPRADDEPGAGTAGERGRPCGQQRRRGGCAAPRKRAGRCRHCSGERAWARRPGSGEPVNMNGWAMNDDVTARARKNGLNWLLDDLVRRLAGAEKAVALSGDGLLLGRSASVDRENAEHLAAMASAFQSLSRGVGTTFGKGAVQQTVVELDDGYLVVTEGGAGACLALLSSVVRRPRHGGVRDERDRAAGGQQPCRPARACCPRNRGLPARRDERRRNAFRGRPRARSSARSR